MSCITGNNGNINETFIIEPLSITGGSPTLSACTSLYTNQIISCSGDTTITLGTGIIIFNGPISATSVNTSNYYSGGTNLLDIFSADTYVTGGTLSGNTLELFRNDNAQININLSDLRFSGGTGHCITDFYVTNIYGCSPITVHDHLIVLSGITLNLPVNDDTLTQVIVRDSISGELKYRNVQSILSGVTGDTFVTGGTPNNSAHTYTFTNNSGGTFTVNGLDDITITGGTYSSGTTTFRNNTGGTFTVTGFTGTDTFVTGFTYNNNNLFTIKQNQGQPDLSVLFNTVSGLTVNGSISGSTFFSGGTNMYNIILSAITENDIYITGASFSGGTLILKRRDGVDFYAPFTGNTSGDCITDLYVSNIYGCSLVTLHNHLIPNIDGSIDLGGELTVTDVNYTGASTTGLTTPWTSTFTGQRFRSINTISGGSTVWTSTYRVNTPNLDLGLDSSGNTRIITADSSVIQDDLLFGGTF